MDIELSANMIRTISDHYNRFEPVALAKLLPQLDTAEKRNLASFQIGMARQLPIPQEHPVLGHFWYPPEMAAAYHLQHSTEKLERLARFVATVTQTQAIDQIHDVGANAGLFAAFCSRLTAASIVCYEPIPALEPYVAANAPEAALRRVALGAEGDATVSFFVNTQSLQTSSLDREAIIEESATVTEIAVPMERLDRVASGTMIVKIDVQGAELQVLAGMSGCIADCEALIVESTYLSIDTITDVIPIARAAGFGWLYVVNDVSFGADVMLTRVPIDAAAEMAATFFAIS